MKFYSLINDIAKSFELSTHICVINIQSLDVLKVLKPSARIVTDDDFANDEILQDIELHSQKYVKIDPITLHKAMPFIEVFLSKHPKADALKKIHKDIHEMTSYKDVDHLLSKDKLTKETWPIFKKCELQRIALNWLEVHFDITLDAINCDLNC